jgi:hypothetical protein
LIVNAMADTANPTDIYLTLREAVAIVTGATVPSGLSAQRPGRSAARSTAAAPELNLPSAASTG